LVVIAVLADTVGLATFGSEVSAFFTSLFGHMTVSPGLTP
jgi:hypothetical protein